MNGLTQPEASTQAPFDIAIKIYFKLITHQLCIFDKSLHFFLADSGLKSQTLNFDQNGKAKLINIPHQ